MTDFGRSSIERILNLEHEIEELFGHLIDRPWGRDGPVDWLPPVDIDETPDAYEVSMDLPGVCADDIELHLRPFEIEICGTRSTRRSSASATRVHAERTTGRFCRTFALQHEVVPDSAQSRCAEGILRVRIKKRRYPENHD